MSVNVYGHDGASFIRDFSLNLGDVETPSVWVAIDQYGTAAGPQHCRNARDDGKARNDAFRSGRRRKSHHCHFERYGAVAQRHAVRDPAIAGPATLKLDDEAPF